MADSSTPVGSIQSPLVTVAKKEPVAFWSLLAGLGNLLQILAIPIAPWLHIVIGILSWVGATIVARQTASPASTAPSANG